MNVLDEPLESTTSERLLIELETIADPTSGSAPEFQVTTGRRSDPDQTWQAGEWVAGSWVEETSTASARTALIGSGQALDVEEAQAYNLFARWSVAGQTPVEFVGVIQVR